MKIIDAFETQRQFRRILNEVSLGETFTITRDGVPVAELRGLKAPDPERVHESIVALRAIRKRVKPDPEGMTICEMIDAGRRF